MFDTTPKGDFSAPDPETQAHAEAEIAKARLSNVTTLINETIGAIYSAGVETGKQQAQADQSEAADAAR